mgnify:CR=1 FL=1
MLLIDVEKIKCFESYGGQSGRLNWIKNCIMNDGSKKVVKRDARGTYIVIDRVRNYFASTSTISKMTLYSVMKEDLEFIKNM